MVQPFSPVPTDTPAHTQASGFAGYHCLMCPLTFPTVAESASHMRTHLNPRPYLCLTCGQRFPFHTELNEHTDAHAEEDRKIPAPIVKTIILFRRRLSDKSDQNDPAEATPALRGRACGRLRGRATGRGALSRTISMSSTRKRPALTSPEGRTRPERRRRTASPSYVSRLRSSSRRCPVTEGQADPTQPVRRVAAAPPAQRVYPRPGGAIMSPQGRRSVSPCQGWQSVRRGRGRPPTQIRTLSLKERLVSQSLAGGHPSEQSSSPGRSDLSSREEPTATGASRNLSLSTSFRMKEPEPAKNAALRRSDRLRLVGVTTEPLLPTLDGGGRGKGRGRGQSRGRDSGPSQICGSGKSRGRELTRGRGNGPNHGIDKRRIRRCWSGSLDREEPLLNKPLPVETLMGLLTATAEQKSPNTLFASPDITRARRSKSVAMRRRTEEQFFCEKCDRRFTQKTSLTYHMVFHT